jgi:chromate transporter
MENRTITVDPDPTTGTAAAPPPRPPTLREAAVVWGRVAALSFGGPAGQVAVMHRIVVDEKRWVSEQRFLHALSYCMLLPGPEAQQLATYLGWLLHGTRGGLLAGGLFVLPGFVSILVLSLLYVGFRHLPLIDGMLYGLKAAVLAVVVEALLRIGKRVLRTQALRLVAVGSFLSIFLLGAPFPLIILLAGLIGVVGTRLAPASFVVLKGAGDAAPDAVIDRLLDARALTRPPLGQSLSTAVLWLGIWLLPLVGLAWALGPDHVLVQIGAFFSQVAVVTFGGAYAVLAYVAQQAVEVRGWVLPGEMLDGLGMAETTPGPLIQVVQFVGFLAAWRTPGGWHPLWAGTAGAVVTTWVTFVPCFLWIFVGAPYVEWLRGNRTLSGALSAITAAVVGVILNLAVWFSLHVAFAEVPDCTFAPGLVLPWPVWASVDPVAVAIGLGAALALLRFHLDMGRTLLAAALLGASARLVFGAG